jgi:hypothetical protein
MYVGRIIFQVSHAESREGISGSDGVVFGYFVRRTKEENLIFSWYYRCKMSLNIFYSDCRLILVFGILCIWRCVMCSVCANEY